MAVLVVRRAGRRSDVAGQLLGLLRRARLRGLDRRLAQAREIDPLALEDHPARVAGGQRRHARGVLGLGDVPRPLEHDVLEKVREAGLARDLVLRADVGIVQHAEAL